MKKTNNIEDIDIRPEGEPVVYTNNYFCKKLSIYPNGKIEESLGDKVNLKYDEKGRLISISSILDKTKKEANLWNFLELNYDKKGNLDNIEAVHISGKKKRINVKSDGDQENIKILMNESSEGNTYLNIKGNDLNITYSSEKSHYIFSSTYDLKSKTKKTVMYPSLFAPPLNTGPPTDNYDTLTEYFGGGYVKSILENERTGDRVVKVVGNVKLGIKNILKNLGEKLGLSREGKSLRKF